MSTEELQQLGAGTQLGRYTLVRKIASGGMAEVYAARSVGVSGFEKKVAIKKILPQFSMNERFIDMLVDEAKITVSLTHPNIAQIYELGLEGDTYYIVMEFVDGRPLNRLMQRLDKDGHQNVPIEHAVHIMAEVAKGLHHAHQQKDVRGEALGIIHRDISPQNILLSYSGDVKLIDFGIARARGRLAQTNAGTIKGKLRYLAPEIARANNPDHRADIFCCGIVLFEMLTGEALYAPRTDIEAIEMASLARVRSPRISNPDIPEDLENIVMKALKGERNDRYQTAKELYTDLRRFSNHHFPAYVGSELADIMDQYFGDEMRAEQDLDRRAESLVGRMGGDLSENTIGVSEDEFGGSDGQDEQTKTNRIRRQPSRNHRPDSRGLSRQDAYRPGVTDSEIEPSQAGFVADDEISDVAVESTQLADNPMRSDRPKYDRRASTLALGRREESMLDYSDRDAPPTQRSHPPPVTAPQPSRHRIRNLLLIQLSLVVAILGLWFGYNTITRNGSDSNQTAQRPKNRPTVSQMGQAGRLALSVEPDVKIDIYVNDDLIQGQVRAPVLIENLDPEVMHRFRISAEGFRTLETQETVRSGQETRLQLKLQRMLGTIELLAMEGGASIESTAGRIVGHRILDVPVGTEVTLIVRRKNGQKIWKRRLVVRSEALIRMEIPPVPKVAKAIRRGRLFVNSRPFSKVYLNGRAKGKTPLTLKLRPGSHRLVLKRPSGKSYSRRVRVRPGRTVKVVYRWP